MDEQYPFEVASTSTFPFETITMNEDPRWNIPYSPYLPEDNLLSSPQLSSDLSSPENSSPEHDFIAIETELFNSEAFFDPFVNLNPQPPLPPPTSASASPLEVLPTSPEQLKQENPKKTKRNTSKTQKQPKQSKKQRSSPLPSENSDVQAVQLDRDQLLHISSAEFEQFVARITATRPLTLAEDLEVKRQLRLIKNRESAQASRARKKEYVDILESQIAELKMQTSQLTNQVNQLVAENRSLREELRQANILLRKTQVPTNNNTSSSVIQFGEVPQKIKTAGVCLMIIFFSFGLFLNNLPSSVRVPTVPRLSYNDIPRVLSEHTNPPSNIEFYLPLRAEVNAGRNIKWTRPESPSPSISSSTPSLSPSPSSASPSTSASAPKVECGTCQPSGHTPYGDKVTPDPAQVIASRAAHLKENSQLQHDAHNSSHAQISQNRVSENVVAEFFNETASANTSHLSDDAEFTHYFEEKVKERPNTVFYMASDFKHVVPETQPLVDPQSPLTLSILVPAKSLPHQGKLLDSHASHPEDVAIRIDAHVIGVYHTHLHLPPTAAAY